VAGQTLDNAILKESAKRKFQAPSDVAAPWMRYVANCDPITFHSGVRVQCVTNQRRRSVAASSSWWTQIAQDEQKIRPLLVIDALTQEIQAIKTAQSFTAMQVIDVLQYLLAVHGSLTHIRSDNGPAFLARKLPDGWNKRLSKRCSLRHAAHGKIVTWRASLASLVMNSPMVNCSWAWRRLVGSLTVGRLTTITIRHTVRWIARLQQPSPRIVLSIGLRPQSRRTTASWTPILSIRLVLKSGSGQMSHAPRGAPTTLSAT